jgi:ribonuclease Z
VIPPDLVVGPTRPGRKLAITGDTAPSPAVVEAVRGADLLVHEATFMEEERERARETSHSTALDAARVAAEAEVGMLALTHLSNRYFGPDVKTEARTVFAETVVPRDFDIIDVPFRERGAARLIKGGARQRRPAEETVAIEEAVT